jgi:hypothetical protein
MHACDRSCCVDHTRFGILLSQAYLYLIESYHIHQFYDWDRSACVLCTQLTLTALSPLP